MGGGVEDKSRTRERTATRREPSVWPASELRERGGRTARSTRVGTGSMGKGANQGEGAPEREATMPTFSWEEIQKHNLRTDKWLVIDRKVYNVTKWSQRHPGGHRVIGHYAGEDATVGTGELSGHPWVAAGRVRNRGRWAPNSSSGAGWRVGRPGGRESVWTPARLPGVLLWISWVSSGPASDLARPVRQPLREVPELGSRALSVARWNPRFPRLSPGARDSPKEGALTLGLALPQRERWPATLGRRDEEPENGRGSSPVWDSARASRLFQPASAGGEGKRLPDPRAARPV